MLFMGSAFAADLFCCILVSIIQAIWDGAGGGLHIVTSNTLLMSKFQRKSTNLKNHIKNTIHKCVQECKIDSNPTHCTTFDK